MLLYVGSQHEEKRYPQTRDQYHHIAGGTEGPVSEGSHHRQVTLQGNREETDGVIVPGVEGRGNGSRQGG